MASQVQVQQFIWNTDYYRLGGYIPLPSLLWSQENTYYQIKRVTQEQEKFAD